MTIPQKTIPGFVSDMAAVWFAQTNTSTVFSDGDPLLAFWQTVATQLDFLQAQVQAVLNMARAQTSTGADLDTWMAQFGLLRLSANSATTQETFIRLTPSASQILIPAGAIVQTVGGSSAYEVVTDPDEAAWNPALNGYVLPAGQLSITATVEALTGGSAGNVLANTITQFGSSVPGIDQCTNLSPITNGADAETDAAFRARFVIWLATLAKATYAALLAAARSVQQGLLISLIENVTPSGTPLLGSFTAIVDDGSGDPPAAILSAVFNALDVTRAFSVEPFVTQPTQRQVSIGLAIRPAIPANTPVTIVAVQNAIAAMVNELGPGATLFASAVVSTALATPGVTAVNPATVTINGGNADLVPTVQQEIRTNTGSISVAQY